MEEDGGDKDSTDHPGEIHSTQQPEDSSENAEPESLSCVGVSAVVGPLKRSKSTIQLSLTRFNSSVKSSDLFCAKQKRVTTNTVQLKFLHIVVI